MAVNQPSETSSRFSLLIVDAEARSRASIAQSLRQKGYSVEEASTGEAALARLDRSPCDLMILDMAIPGMSGVDLMLRARLRRRDLLIVVLTAHATLESAIAAVKADVVDYMLKPCRVDDLVLTISRALEERAEQRRHQRLLEMVGQAMATLQRSEAPLAEPAGTKPAAQPAERNVLKVGTLALDPDKRVVTLNTDPPRTVELTEGEASILQTLMHNPNRVLSYNQLASSALGYEGMDKWTVESVVRSSVFRLRQKLEPGPEGPRLICTVRGRGYYFSPLSQPN